MSTLKELQEQFASAMMDLEDETARNKVKVVVEGEWDDLRGELTITTNVYTGECETYNSYSASSVMECIVEMVHSMNETRKQKGKQ